MGVSDRPLARSAPSAQVYCCGRISACSPCMPLPTTGRPVTPGQINRTFTLCSRGGRYHASIHKLAPGPLRSPCKQTANINTTSSHQSSQARVTIEESWRLSPSSSGYQWPSWGTLDAALPRWGRVPPQAKVPCGRHPRNDVTRFPLP